MFCECQVAHSFDLLGKKHKWRRVSAEEEKWRSATSAYEAQNAKVEGLRKEISSQVQLTRDLRWKVRSRTAQLADLSACLIELET